MRSTRPTLPLSRQTGVSLIAVMMVLVIVTLLGLSAVQISSMSERGARNERDAQIAFQAAEAALTDAWIDIRGTGTGARTTAFNGQIEFEADCGTSGTRKGLCLPASTGTPVWLSVDLTDSPSVALGEFTGRSFQAAEGSTSLGIMPAAKPRYVIESLVDQSPGLTQDAQSEQQRYLYRVTAIGFGPRSDIQTVLQALYRK